MESLAPAVVAVVVAHDPGSWFEESLASFAAQDYPELSLLVLDTGTEPGLRERVGAVYPTAYVREVGGNRGYGPTANDVRSMVEGATFFLFSHDDVAPASDAVHLLVEEAFRSNAGIVSPKFVGWDDTRRLLHVGMMVDPGGSVVDRVHADEVDHGQLDAVRDVFVAPGGFTLVRSDLFEQLGGFDPTISLMGEDLDLCWRAQLVGARVIVAPDAVVRHREELASGARPVDQELVAPPGTASDGSRPPVTLRELQRRHELLAVAKCYGRLSLWRFLPQLMLLAAAEITVAELAGDRGRGRAVLRAWMWNAAGLRRTFRARRVVQGARRVPDHEVRALQVSGTTRVAAYVRRVAQHGFHGAHDDGAHDDTATPATAVRTVPDAASVPPVPGVGRGGTGRGGGGPGSPERGGGEAIDRPGPAGGGERERSPDGVGRLSTGTAVAVWGLVVAVLLFGSRSLLGGAFPVVGELLPFPGWAAAFGSFGAAWHGSGFGSTAPASPALALLGVVGTMAFGAMGVAEKLVVFGCLPVGAWGTFRLVRRFGSRRAGLVAAVAYLALPLAYDAIALGRIDALVAFAVTPWVMVLLFRMAGADPVVGPRARRVRRERVGDGAMAWADRHPYARLVVGLGVIEAVLVSFAPAGIAIVLGVALALVVSSAVRGGWRETGHAALGAVASSVVAAVLCLPWVVGVASSGRVGWQVFGIRTPPSAPLPLSALVRFADGPIGNSPLAWGFAAAAFLPLVIARHDRFRWATRCWTVTLVFWLAAWASSRGWTGDLSLPALVLLAPAAAAAAASIGIGIAAFEEDLRSAVFGIRQAATAVAAVAVVLGAFPMLASTFSGRWDLPETSFAQAVSWMHAEKRAGSFRVLWLGDPRALAGPSWSASSDGLAYATSIDGPPAELASWVAPDPKPAGAIVGALALAERGGTDQLGRLLAPDGIRYIAVVTSLAPVVAGVQQPQAYPVPGGLLPALDQQIDLSPVFAEPGITVYENADWIPVRAEVPPGTSVPTGAVTPVSTTAPASAILARARPVLASPPDATSFHGRDGPGTVYLDDAPPDRWEVVDGSGTKVRTRLAFGWAQQFTVTRSQLVTVQVRPGGWVTAGVVYQVLVWLAALALLAGIGRLFPPVTTAVGWRRRRRRRGRGTAHSDPPAMGSAGDVVATGSDEP